MVLIQNSVDWEEKNPWDLSMKFVIFRQTFDFGPELPMRIVFFKCFFNLVVSLSIRVNDESFCALLG